MANVPAEGIRINLQDSVAKSLEEIYQDVVSAMQRKYPKLSLTEHTIVAHVKTCLDGTLDPGSHRKRSNRVESNHCTMRKKRNLFFNFQGKPLMKKCIF